jgi:mono/diheme cytochrome c family protein
VQKRAFEDAGEPDLADGAVLKDGLAGEQEDEFHMNTVTEIDHTDAIGGMLNTLLGNALGLPENIRPMRAPVSYPQLWDSGYYDYTEWNGMNKNSGYGPLGRNVGEVLGAFGRIDLGEGTKHTVYKSSIRVGALVHIEELSRKLHSPLWPDAFGAIDTEKAARGRALYDADCLICHPRIPRTDPDRAPRSTMVPLDEIGTDPAMAEQFATRAAQAGVLEGRCKGLGGTEVIGAEVSGVEAVPTLYDLLLPPAERPSEFTTGRFEIDVERVGIVHTPFEGGFLFDTTIDGNRNGGHEYGTSLSDDQRWDLVEYLKTL